MQNDTCFRRLAAGALLPTVGSVLAGGVLYRTQRYRADVVCALPALLALVWFAWGFLGSTG